MEAVRERPFLVVFSVQSACNFGNCRFRITGFAVVEGSVGFAPQALDLDSGNFPTKIQKTDNRDLVCSVDPQNQSD